MELKNRIQEDLKSALRAQEKRRLIALRLLLSSIRQREIDQRITLQDSDIIAVIEKMIKQRKDSIEQFKKGQRPDLVSQEEEEVTILSSYLPTQLSETEIKALISEVVSKALPDSKDMGTIMRQLKPLLQGRADMSLVSGWVKEILG